MESLTRQMKSARDTLQSQASLNGSTGRSAVHARKPLGLNAPLEAGPPVNKRQGSTERNGRQVAALLKKPLGLNVPVEPGHRVHRSPVRLKQRHSPIVPVGAGLVVES